MSTVRFHMIHVLYVHTVLQLSLYTCCYQYIHISVCRHVSLFIFPCQPSLSMRYCLYLRGIVNTPVSPSIVTPHCRLKCVTVCICVPLFVSSCQLSVSTWHCLYSRVIVCFCALLSVSPCQLSVSTCYCMYLQFTVSIPVSCLYSRVTALSVCYIALSVCCCLYSCVNVFIYINFCQGKSVYPYFLSIKVIHYYNNLISWSIRAIYYIYYFWCTSV